MGILEILLIIVLVLKFLGLALATTSYWAILGYYVAAVAVLTVIVIGLKKLEDAWWW